MVTVEKDVNPLYYFDNFTHLLTTVTQYHSQLLSAEELSDINGFLNLSHDAQLLWLRLLGRRGALIRIDKIRYDEIGNINLALEELIEQRFVALNPKLEAIYWLDTLTLSELRDVFQLCEKENRSDTLSRVLASRGDKDAINTIIDNFPAVQLLRCEFTATLRLLYFGNLYQDLTEFIIAELGHVRYPNYRFDPKLSPYKTRADIDKVFKRLQFESEFQDYKSQATASPETLVEDMLEGDHISKRQWYRVGQYLEQQTEFDYALRCYEQAEICPSRERSARVCLKQGKFDKAAALVNDMLKNPLEDSELYAANRLAKQLIKRDYEFDLSAAPWSSKTIIIDLIHTQPELNAIDYFEHNNTRAFWFENSVWLSLFGLLFWDEIFAAVDGAFLHPFQRAPLDLHHPNFLSKRNDLFSQRCEYLLNNDLIEELAKAHERHNGVASRLINWNITLDDLTTIVKTIEPSKLLELMLAIADNIRTRRSGFPDLCLISNNTLSLREIKGPGDQLRDNQRFWLSWFSDHGWDVGVINVRYRKAQN